jgi:hypothetical protein
MSQDTPTVADLVVMPPLIDASVLHQPSNAPPLSKDVFRTYVCAVTQSLMGCKMITTNSDATKLRMVCKACYDNKTPGRLPSFRYYFKLDINSKWLLVDKYSNLRSHSHPFTTPSFDTLKIDVDNHNLIATNEITSMNQITNDEERYAKLLEWCSKHRSARRQEIASEIKDRYGVKDLTDNVLNNVTKRLRIESGAGGHTPGEDFNAFINKLIANSRDDGSYWQFDSDPETNQMTRFIYQSVQMKAAWRRCGQFLVMDCTCKTNVHNLPIFLIIGVDENNVSVILAWALLKSESTASFGWVFDQLRTAMGDDAINMVNTVATDGCASMDSALSQKFPHVNRLRCIWHLLQNLKEKCGGSSSDNKKHIESLFLDCAHAPIKEILAERRSKLIAKCNEINSLALNEWITKMFEDDNLKTWAKAYTKHFTTFGATTTQRVESMNAILKNRDYLGKASTHANLYDLYNRVRTVEDEAWHRAKQTTKSNRILNQLKNSLSSFPGFDKLSVFAKEQIHKTFLQTGHCQAEPLALHSAEQRLLLTDDSEDHVLYYNVHQTYYPHAAEPFAVTYCVSINRTHCSCSCGRPMRYLLPCCHVMKANDHAFKRVFIYTQIHKRYTCTFDALKHFPPYESRFTVLNVNDDAAMSDTWIGVHAHQHLPHHNMRSEDESIRIKKQSGYCMLSELLALYRKLGTENGGTMFTSTLEVLKDGLKVLMPEREALRKLNEERLKAEKLAQTMQQPPLTDEEKQIYNEKELTARNLVAPFMRTKRGSESCKRTKKSSEPNSRGELITVKQNIIKKNRRTIRKAKKVLNMHDATQIDAPVGAAMPTSTPPDEASPSAQSADEPAVTQFKVKIRKSRVKAKRSLTTITTNSTTDQKTESTAAPPPFVIPKPPFALVPPPPFKVKVTSKSNKRKMNDIAELSQSNACSPVLKRQHIEPRRLITES